MFSVDIDKLIKMTAQQEESYKNIADNIIATGKTDARLMATIGNGINAFLLANTFMQMGKKVLFVDADYDAEAFLGKYRLGKELKGFLDAVSVDNTDERYDLVCVTNYPQMDILFTGNTEHTAKTVLVHSKVRRMLEEYMQNYDLVLVQSDSSGHIACCCDQTILFEQRDSYVEEDCDQRVKELDEKGCFVLGVIIDE